MGSPFKMNPKSPMMKALVGKQGNLPQHLQDAIKAAPETSKKGSPAKSYGSKSKSPLKKGPGDRDAKAKEQLKTFKPGRDSTDVIIDEKKSINKRRPNSRSGKTNFLRSEQLVEKQGLGSTPGTTQYYREGGGRLGTKTYEKMQNTGGPGSMIGSSIAGAKKKNGSYYRRLADGSRVLNEATLAEQGGKITKRKASIKSPKPTASADMSELKRRVPRKKQQTVNTIKKKKAQTTAKISGADMSELKKRQTKGKSPAQMRGVKNLKGSPVKSVGSANKQARLKKKANKLSDKAMNFPGNKPVSDKRAGKLLDRSRKLKDKARKLRNKA